ncbi:MAG: CPBP family intramembrane glutamic endopeptidase [Rubricoccaceae bacterium]|nr:CPBP family intramembrane glutamic endopeptidase [Rubricoccaceae bacterium]
MPFRLRSEWHGFRDGLRRLDTQATVVLTAAVVLVFLQLQFGTRSFFADHVAADPADARGLPGWAWWFGMQGVLGFLIPVLILTVGFRRRPSEIGLGLGDWKLAGVLALLYAVPVVIGTWVLSNGADFQAHYPHLDAAQTDWGVFLAYEALFLFYWIGWEYLWRGFVLFGTAPAFGLGAIVVQMVPFAILHADKPAAEAYLSILGGLALGALVWRCRSFWIAVPIHAFQMLALDFWCSLRARSGAEGIGLDALAEALRTGLGG